MTETMLVIVGPTGTGKTALSLGLAERLGRDAVEIVNADAMQLYRGMDIGTAKVPEDQRMDVPHHLFDVLDVTEESTAAAFQPEARSVIRDIINERQRIPILVGGSGLYVSSVLYEFDFPGTDAGIRERLEREFITDGVDALMQRLRGVDPEGAAVIDAQNPRRVIRALEIFELTGTPMRIGLPEKPKMWQESNIIGLFDDRPTLTDRLDKRVADMWKRGMVEEVANLRSLGLERGVTASRAIGYAQALDQLRGHLSETAAIEQTQALTRRLARRQMSWFKRYPGIRWFHAGSSGLAERVLDPSDPGDS